MEWTDDAIVLAVRAHGETSVILDALSRRHGRHGGLVRGGKSRQARPQLQPGNSLYLTWRARLADHLGHYSIDTARARSGVLMDKREALTGLNAVCAVLIAALPEREPHESLFDAAEILLDAMVAGEFADWAPLFVRFEAGLLDELGFGMDLTECAATGGRDDLIYVSPKSGRAVSAGAGEPYRDKLFALPAFLLGTQAAILPHDIAQGLALTGHFLFERVLAPHGLPMPAARARLGELAARESR